MTTATTENLQEVSLLNPTMYSIFAKASYLKDAVGNKFNNTTNKNAATSALEYWQNGLGMENPEWTAMSGVAGIGEDGVSSSWAGFQAVAYKNETTKEIVIAYRGTDSVLDAVYSDGQIAFNVTPQQTTPALAFYDNISNSVSGQGYTISVTGHSLGGVLAQYVAASKHVSGVTFNAPGVNIPAGGDASGIVNYVNMNNFIGCLNQHLGETRYYLPDGLYMDGSFKPHSDYIGQDFNNYVTLPDGVNWTLGESLALWGYDVNNHNTSLKAILSPMVTQNNLKSALDKLNNYYVNSGMQESFIYSTLNNTYALGNSSEMLNSDIIKSIENKYGLTEEQLFNVNDFLRNRFTEDKSLIYLKKDEQITIPQEALQSTDISDMYDGVSSDLKDGYTKPDIPLPDGTDVSLPSHGKPVDEDVRNYTTPPPMLSKEERGFIILNGINGHNIKDKLNKIMEVFGGNKKEAENFLRKYFNNPRYVRELGSMVVQSAQNIISNPLYININWGGLGYSLDTSLTFTPNYNNLLPSQNYPMAIDLGGDGLKTVDINKSEVYFDVDNDGFREKTGWISKEEGILAIDKNGNGKIDNQNEMFGSTSATGFEELKSIDSNNDGVIDAKDSDFDKIRVWQDLNLAA